MTLCLVWRQDDNVHFASDSRLSFGSAGTSDFGIKVVRLPFNIYGASNSAGNKPLLWAGQLGMAFAGLATGALMLKEAVAEALYSVQSVGGFQDFGMDGIAEFLRGAYELISGEQWKVTGRPGRTVLIFAGFCGKQDTLRAFRIERVDQDNCDFREVLSNDGDFELMGSGAGAAAAFVSAPANQRMMIAALEKVIDDPTVKGVGGNIQYGRFEGADFRPMGVARLGMGVHYWRGPLDLNAPQFSGANGFIPNFPYLDMIS